MEFVNYNEDYGKNELGNQVENSVTQMSALHSLLVGEELSKEELSFIKEFKCVKDFLEMPINDSKEKNLKKMFAAAIVMAKEKGVVPFETDMSPIAIASAIDEGLTRLKTGYQITTGELDTIEAADILIDKATARIIAIADKAIDHIMPIVVDKLCQVLVKKYPPVTTVVPIIKRTERYITVATKAVVRKGIRAMAGTAKSVVREMAEKTTRVTCKTVRFLKA
ncbi:hypothetical protein [Phocaeicola vulgatus]|jgi:hypothetical protein|uniref:Uncharacterized protein n=1 Tax=Phocaeicola vulgatus TaxID=821 RepID=A0A412QTY4_PHOVU|nr:hypothetical protein [Phocaeicola vulgatus]MCG0153790.1 hypothetical protein [Phocaeicola vulgatus]MCG0328397.1 hypothetical protein [Phocaeicola vulgatus]MCG0332268.1 hypothetical protein [Phocaeicola vulgatus]RGT94427.1 hypothetical protein DWX04_09150 [Phocaeicola vulgatus]